MAISFISGKPGAGKSLLGTKYGINELVDGQRLVATNLPLNSPRLNEYLQQRYPDASVDLFKRLRILSEEEVKEFWKYRARDGVEDKGCLFILDEIHLFFNARKWMDTGEACLHYLSQHRKLGDDVICITQHVENVDKQFRSVAQDFTVVSNGYKQRVGAFRGLPCFTRKTYSSAPNGGDKQIPFEVSRFTLDKDGIASCYDTAAGIGVHGRDADKEKKTKGLHPVFFVVGILAFICAIFFGLKGVMGFVIGKANTAMEDINGMQKKPAAEVQKSPSVDTRKTGGNSAAAGDRPEVSLKTDDLHAASPGQMPGADRDQVRVRGYTVAGKKVTVVLTDGRVFNETDDELEKIGRGYVMISGQKYRVIQPGPGAPLLKPETAIPAQMVEEKLTPLPLPPPPPESSWETASDGVSRLKVSESLATALSR